MSDSPWGQVHKQNVAFRCWKGYANSLPETSSGLGKKTGNVAFFFWNGYARISPALCGSARNTWPFCWIGYARISLSTLLGWARNKPWLTNFYWVRYVRKVDFIGKGHTTPQVTGPSTYVECSAFPPWGLQECQEGRSKLKSNIQFPPSRAQKLKRYYHSERCLDVFTTMWIRNTDELS